MRARIDTGVHLLRSEVSPRLQERLRRALSFPNPEYLDRLRLRLSTRDVPERLCFLEQAGGELRLPRGAIHMLKRLAAVEGEIVHCDDHRSVPPERLDGMPIPSLRPYQERAVAAMVSVSQGTIVVPCGGGKTRIGVAALARLATPTLILVHTLDLAEQWRSQIRELLGVEAGLVGDGEEQIAPVTVALVQAVARRERLLSELLQKVGLLVVDECLPAIARVIVRNRGSVPISEAFRLGDIDILSFDHERNQAEFRKVIGRSRKVVRRRFVVLRIKRRQSMLTLRVTEEHPVYVEGRGYVRAIDVRTSDRVLVLARFYPCPRCEAAFASPGSVGGHLSCVHGAAAAHLEPSQQPGGICPRCGRIYATQGCLRVHIQRHDDPALDLALRKANSERMRATNLRRSAILSERMRRQNPMAEALTREKSRRSHWIRPAEFYDHLNGGNGRGPTVPESLLHQRLGPGWIWQLVVPTGRPRSAGLPTHYKLDLAHPGSRVAVEIDGHSHQTVLGRERDRKKDAWLASHGWRCRRFKNSDVLKHPDAVAASVSEVLRCTK